MEIFILSLVIAELLVSGFLIILMINAPMRDDESDD